VPIIANPDRRGAAAVQIDFDPARAGIERVLDQFLDDGGRPLDDLAGRDLVDQILG